jgi:hypothetical protein
MLARPVPRLKEARLFVKNAVAPMLVTLLGMVTEVSELFSSALLPIRMTLPLLAKITDATLEFRTQELGISPVIVEPTCSPEELKALEVVMGASPELATRAVLLPLTDIP